MRSLAGLLVALALALPGVAQAKLTTDDVIKMVKAGLPEAVVVATVKASGAVFDLGANDIIKLHKAGVPTKVIEAMVETSKAAKASAPAPAPDDRARRQAEEDRRAEEARRRREDEVRRERARREEEERRERARREDDRRRRASEERRADEEERRRGLAAREAERVREERRREEDRRREAVDRRRREDEERRAGERRARELEERRERERRRIEEERREEDRRRADEERRREEDRRAEERRRREEREREDRERRRVAEEQRLAEKYAVFARGKSLASAGKHLQAAGVFFEFYSQLAAPDTQEYYDAEYFLARELQEGGLGHAALRYLTNVVLRGPRDPNFRKAFGRLRLLNEQLLVSSPEVMEKLSSMLVDRFPVVFRDEFNYTLGKFYNRWGNFTKAARFLEQVSERSPFYASAAYLRGLMLLRDKRAKSAHEMFKKAVLAAEKSPDRKGGVDKGVLELGYLSLARLAYEVGGHEAAIFYYDKIPHDSTKLGQALFEKGWVHFQAGNYPLALGVFHGLHSAYFKDRFHPDLYILESTIYLNMCHFTMAKELVEHYTRVYGKLHKDLKAMLAAGTPPQELFQLFLRTGEGRAGLPIQLYNYVLQDAEFADLVAALKDYDHQLQVLRAVLRAEVKGEKLWREGLGGVEARRDKLYRQAGLMIRQKLQKAEQEIGEFLIKADEITFETINAEKEQLDREAAALMTGTTLKEGKLKAEKKLEVPWTHEYWEYDGEVWADEVDAYRSLLQDGCKE